MADLTISIPFVPRSPYLCLHIKHWGWQCGPKPRQIFHVMLIWGRYFTDGGGFKSWEIHLPIKRHIL